jgi:HEAT repeat protein
LKIVNQDKRQIILETHTMKPRSNHSGVTQRRIPWFAIAIAVTIAVSGFGRFAAAQQPAPRAQQSGNDAASGKRDLIDDEKLFPAEPKIAPFVFTYPNVKGIDTEVFTTVLTDERINKYSQAGSKLSGLLTKYQDFDWDYKFKPLFTQTPGAFGVGGGVGSGYGVGVASGKSQSADDDPCEFKIEVLQALFRSDVARGTAVATDWLKPGSTQTLRCKGAALTLLARYAGKSATPVILGVARNDTDVKLRAKAISVLGQSNDDSVIDALREFALNSPDTDISEAAIYALGQHNSERAMAVLGEIATSNRPIPLRRWAIGSISGRPGEPAVDALLKIYDTDQNVEIRKSVIGGLSRRKSERAGAKLLEIARGADNIELRKSAINGIARRSGDQAVDILLSLYDTEKNDELKDQIINSLSGSNDPRVTRKLIEIAKNPQTPMERRKRAIGSLSRSKDPAVLQFLEDLLKQ